MIATSSNPIAEALDGLAIEVSRAPETAADVLDALGRGLISIAESLRGSEPMAPRPPTPAPTPAPRSPVAPPGVAPPQWLLDASAGRQRPCLLQGTAKQVAWAEKIRKTKLASAKHRCGPEVVAALSIIKDSTWWIANAERPLAALDWPSSLQVEPRDPGHG